MIYERWGSLKYKYRGRQFWCRGYYVDTAGKNAKAIQEYIQNQLKQDQLSEQLTFDVVDPFKGQQVEVASGGQTNAIEAWLVIQALWAA